MVSLQWVSSPQLVRSDSPLGVLRSSSPPWLILLSGLLGFSPLLDGGTTHVAVMTIRLVLLLLLGLYLAKAVQAGALVIPVIRLAPAMLVYLFLASLLTVFSPYLNQSLQWLLVLLGYAGLLYLIVFFSTKWNHVVTLLVVVVGTSLFEALVALCQGVWFGFPRPRGTFFNPNFLAGYLAVSWTVVLSCLCYAPIKLTAGRRSRLHCRALVIELVLPLTLLAVLLCAMVWTGSRGGLLAALLGTVVVVSMRFGRKGVGLILLLVALGVVVPNPLRDRLYAEHAVNPVGYARWQMWQSAVRVMLDQPMGVGLGLYQYVSPRYAFPVEEQIARYGKEARTPHSEYLQMGVELGALSVLVFAWGIGLVLREVVWLLRQRLRRRQRMLVIGVTGGMIGVLGQAAVDSNLHEPALAIVLTCLVGILLSFRKLLGLESRPAWVVPFSSRLTWGIVGSVLVVGVTITVCRLGLGWLSYETGAQFLAQHKHSDAISSFNKAINLDPGKALYHSALAATYFQVFQKTGDQEAAQTSIDALRVAIRLNPLDARLQGLVGHVSSALADRSTQSLEERRSLTLSALAAYEQAEELSPFNPFYKFELGRLHLALGHEPKAEAYVKKAIEVEPNFLPGREWLARVYLRAERIDAAKHELQQIVMRKRRYAVWHKSPLEERFLQVDSVGLAEELDGVRSDT